MYENHQEIPSPLQALWDVLDDGPKIPTSVLRMSGRATAFVCVTAFLIGPYAVAGIVNKRAKRAVALAWYRACTWICGLDVDVRGELTDVRPALIAVNHVSYLDIIVLGRLIDGRFVAKSDVATWPLFGLLSRMAGTVFVTRDRARAGRDCAAMRSLIANGERLVLFPEGTSSNGHAVLPFRSALFAAVDPKGDATDTLIQPVTIAYTTYADGRALNGELTDLYAWYGDMTLFGHLMRVFGVRGARVEITLHTPVRAGDFANRKQLAAATEATVRQGLNESLAR